MLFQTLGKMLTIASHLSPKIVKFAQYFEFAEYFEFAVQICRTEYEKFDRYLGI